MVTVSMHSLWHWVLRRNAPKNLLSFQLLKIFGEADGWMCHKRPFLMSCKRNALRDTAARSFPPLSIVMCSSIGKLSGGRHHGIHLLVGIAVF
ncbi:MULTISPECIES: hypothetical protein [Micrococcaceae]|uniref:hypothetical protein n=1 Tax=Micrococcaceae TaxID=1268 RepID=UPI00128B828B|nr:hypothetical protein [Arthrobacter sp. YC-RL1]